MAKFLLHRFLWMLLTLWIVFTISFFLMRSVPGGPFDRERKMDPQIEANLRARYRLDEPMWKQYTRCLISTAKGDLGYSFTRADYTVNEVIAQGLPVSASLGIFAMTIAVGIGLSAGILSAVYRNTTIDHFVMTLATVGITLPSFVIASLGIILFVFLLPIFPAGGWGSLRQLILPAFCLGGPYAAYIARLTRTGMLDVLSQDYIRTAWAKGLRSRTVILKHALKGALLPVVSYLGPAIAGILTGSLVVEQIFFIPGLGAHFIEAATQRDYTLAMGLVLLFTLLLYIMNTLVDITYGMIDPRVRMDN